MWLTAQHAIVSVCRLTRCACATRNAARHDTPVGRCARSRYTCRNKSQTHTIVRGPQRSAPPCLFAHHACARCRRQTIDTATVRVGVLAATKARTTTTNDGNRPVKHQSDVTQCACTSTNVARQTKTARCACATKLNSVTQTTHSVDRLNN